MSARERALLALLHEAEERRGRPIRSRRELGERAAQHGVLGPVLEAAGADADVDPSEILARELDHVAQLEALTAIDGALAARGLGAVVLKGALLARRLYARPALRASGDVDLLVREDRLDAALATLGSVGYRWEATEREAWYRREHHHLHLDHPAGMPLELHFDAYRGLGSRLPGGPLLATSVPAEGFAALRTLAPAEELVFLSVHAAAHRFVRLGWTLDIALLLDRMTAAELAEAWRVAASHRYANVVRFAVARAAPLCARPPSVALAPVRRLLADRVVDEPDGRLLRAATRILFGLALSDGVATAGDLLWTTVRHHAH